MNEKLDDSTTLASICRARDMTTLLLPLQRLGAGSAASTRDLKVILPLLMPTPILDPSQRLKCNTSRLVTTIGTLFPS
jgi:hypothetical protein